jgi:hypothetical protein
MLARLLSLLGLQALFDRAKYRVESLLHDAEATVRTGAKEFGLIAAFGLVAAVMAFVTFVVLLIGVYIVVRQAFGPPIALVAVILIPALLTALFAVLVMTHVNAKGRSEPSRLFPKPAPIPEPSEIPRRPPESVSAGWPTQSAYAPRFAPSSTDHELQLVLADALGTLLGSIPATGTPIDRFITRLTGEATASSRQTVDLAADAISFGSRKAVFGILAGSALLGWFIGRKALPGSVAAIDPTERPSAK